MPARSTNFRLRALVVVMALLILAFVGYELTELNLHTGMDRWEAAGEVAIFILALLLASGLTGVILLNAGILPAKDILLNRSPGQGRILVVGPGCLSAGIAALLADDSNLSITYSAADDEAAIKKAIRLNRPDIVLLSADLPLAEAGSLVGAAGGRRPARVISVSMDHNVVQVYDHAEVTITVVDDLLPLVRPWVNEDRSFHTT